MQFGVWYLSLGVIVEIHHYVIINKDINAGDKRSKRFVFPSVMKPGGRISSNTSQLIRHDYRLFYRHLFVSPVFFVIHQCHHLTSSVVEKLKRRFICFLFNTIFQCHKKISCSKDNGEKKYYKMIHLEIKPWSVLLGI